MVREYFEKAYTFLAANWAYAIGVALVLAVIMALFGSSDPTVVVK